MNTSETRAKSRIVTPAARPADQKASLQVPRRERTRSKPNFTFALPSVPKFNMRMDEAWLIKYFSALPYLVLSLILYSILVYIFFNVHPIAVANWLLFQSYLPILVLFFFGTAFLFRFLLLAPGKSWVVSTWLTLLLFLKLQSFELTILLVIVSGVALVGPSLIWRVLFKK